MNKQRRIIKEHEISFFNKMREKYCDSILSYNELLNLFVEGGIKNPRQLIEKWCNYTIPIIIKMGRGKYTFSKTPVFMDALQNAWNYEQPEDKVSKVESSLEDQIEDAILLLSDNGYKVLKQIFDYESAMKSPEKSVSSFIRWEEVI